MAVLRQNVLNKPKWNEETSMNSIVLMEKNKLIRHIYYFFKRLFKALEAFYVAFVQPLAALKGEDFERCLRRKVFRREEYDLVMKTHDFHSNQKDYVESSLYPDYLFRDKRKDKEFFVEAKYREKTYQGKVPWCNESQFRRYKKLSVKTPVVIAIGLGGRPSNPEQIFLVPLDHIEYNSLYPSFLEKYEFKGNRKNVLDFLADKVYDYS